MTPSIERLARASRGLVGLVVAGAVGAACTTTSIVSAHDHGSFPVTKVEVLKTEGYLLWSTVEHVFLLCQDTPEALVCSRECGGATDLVCPATVVTDVSPHELR